MTEEKIKRINELYHKSKSEGLTADEKEEQRVLRQEYLNAIRANIDAQMANVSIVNADGTVTPVKKKK